MQISLNQHRVLVTGGTKGIGRAITTACALSGAHVIATFLSNPDTANSFVSGLKAEGLNVDSLKMDVRDTQSVQLAVDQLESKFGPVSVLVNNAGVVRDNLIMSMDDAEWRDVMEANLDGNFKVTRAVSRMMVRARRGSIINISSVAASRPGRGQANYAASKGGVEAMTKALAVELSPKNIRVNAIAPGVIATEMSREVRELAGEKILDSILMKRFGNPEDISAAVVFLASDFASYITGEVLHIDGGLKL